MRYECTLTTPQFPRTRYAGNSVYGADGRSYGRGVTSHGPGAIGPGLCGLPGIILLGSSVNRGIYSPLALSASSLESPTCSAGKKQERNKERCSCSTIWEKMCERFQRAVERTGSHSALAARR